jgi:hypothetical protein
MVLEIKPWLSEFREIGLRFMTANFWFTRTLCLMIVGDITLKTVSLKVQLISYAVMDNLSMR